MINGSILLMMVVQDIKEHRG